MRPSAGVIISDVEWHITMAQFQVRWFDSRRLSNIATLSQNRPININKLTISSVVYN